MEDRDKLIDNLLFKVSEKRDKIGLVPHVSYKTNASYCPDIIKNTTRININVLDENSLMYLLSKIEGMISDIDSVRGLYSIEAEYVHHGYSLEMWRDDVLAKLQYLQIIRQRRELDILEKRLNELVSDEKKEMKELLQIIELLK